MIFLLFVGDLSCSELASTGFLFEQRSTGATARRSDCPPTNDYSDR
ncbi:MAG: hypothetical protein LBT09_13690 [Planctomycetaceae bacterium]|jgi:hypothetical protein|nr:hypothetical protein [Planctomycetaceae bacterium]